MLFAFFVLAFAVSPAAAQTPQRPDAPRGDWRVSIGGMGMLAPSFEGSDRMKVRALPMVDVEWRETVFLDTRRGLGANLLTLRDPNGRGTFRAGALVNWRFARDEDDDSDLRGLGDVKGGADVGAFANYEFGPFGLGLLGRKNVSHSELGATIEVSARYRTRLAERTMLVVGPAATWADSDYMRSYFGVTAAQARASGLTAYTPSSGFKDVGVSGAVVQRFAENWSLVGNAGYARLIGDAADAPLVKQRGSPNQFRVGLGVTYRLF
ncbi:MAG: MipA/OmpV family protein [Tagaea sp.]|nr:MipA/OmpV family protein [Tagaea sp.]